MDSEKAAANLRKHDVDFADAATALSDELALTVSDDDPDEERFVTIGLDALGDSSWWHTPGEPTTCD